jgi:hypothetical protein
MLARFAAVRIASVYANFQKEEISRAYVAVVNSASGCSVMTKQIDDDGFDLQLHRSGGTSPQLAVSLKATADDDRTETNLRYKLRKSDHEHLRRTTLVPRILVVLVVEADLDDTIVHEEDALRLTKGAYWRSFVGEEASDTTTKVSVELPRRQQFSPGALTSLMDSIEAVGRLV